MVLPINNLISINYFYLNQYVNIINLGNDAPKESDKTRRILQQKNDNFISVEFQIIWKHQNSDALRLQSLINIYYKPGA